MMTEIQASRGKKEIRRNNPCPCRSGRKYKRCCMPREEPQPQLPHNFNPAQVRLEMEKMMGQIAKIAETKNLSIEDLNRLIVGKKIEDIAMPSTRRLPSKHRGSGLRTWCGKRGTPAVKKRIKLAEEALEIYPNLADAYLILADEKAKTLEQALEFLEKAVAVGREDLGEEFIRENTGHFWGLTETRPFMRAKANLAETLWELGRRDEAITRYEECLRLNPNDNQGLRDTIASLYLELGRLPELEALFKSYKGDGGACWAYSKALYEFSKAWRRVCQGT